MGEVSAFLTLSHGCSSSWRGPRELWRVPRALLQTTGRTGRLSGMGTGPARTPPLTAPQGAGRGQQLPAGGPGGTRTGAQAALWAQGGGERCLSRGPFSPQRGARLSAAGGPLPAGAEPHGGRGGAELPRSRARPAGQAGALAGEQAACEAGLQEIQAQMLLVPVTGAAEGHERPAPTRTNPALTPHRLLPPLPPSDVRVWVAPAFIFLTVQFNVTKPLCK